VTCRERGIEPKLAKRRTEHGSGLGVYRWVALAAGSAWGDDPLPTVEQVRGLLRKGESQNSGDPQLVKFGARALPAYEVILGPQERTT
jgi:hypothetical protein